jgi:TonB family protein
MGSLQDDIIKYKKGELSPKEMHALEKRALTDPFLAEALEGFENISAKDLADDVEEINKRILKDRKTILFTPLRIAAGIILVSATIFLFYQLIPKHETIALRTEKQNEPISPQKTEAGNADKKKELKENGGAAKSIHGAGEKSTPQKAKVELLKTKNENLIAKVDHAAENLKPKIETQPVIAEQKEMAGPEKKTEEAKVEVQDKAPVAVALEPVKEITEQSDLKAESVATGRAKKTKYRSETLGGAGLPGKVPLVSKSISGKVISAEDKLPIPGVNVVIDGTTIGTVTDANGNFTLRNTNENQRLVFSFIGLQTQEVNIDRKDKVDVELKNDATQLSEVVVAALGITKDEDAEPVIHLANPIGGKKAYYKYLEANVRYPEEALKSNIKGKVRVEFAVHPDGSLDQYKVVKSLGYGCDEEVIRLIKEGPKWSPTTENGQPVESTVRVGVKFDPSKSGR